MPHNESRAHKAPEPELESESVKPSKLSRVKSAAFTAAWIIIPVAVTGGSIATSYKMSKMNFETAKLNLEAAKIGRDLAVKSLKS